MRKKKSPKILINSKFGRLTVVSLAGQDKYSIYQWNCICECGNTTIVKSRHLTYGSTKSCGCLNREMTTNRNRRPKGQAGFTAVKNAYLRGAKNRNLEFKLTDNDLKIIFKMNCGYCGKEPQQIKYGSNVKTTEALEHCKYVYNGIDRINSDLGYSIENILPCCKVCNTMKMSLTLEEFLDHIEIMYNYNKKYYTLIKKRVG